MFGGTEDSNAAIPSASSDSSVDWLERATNFFTCGVLPDILGKWCTKSRKYSSAESPQASGRLQQNSSQDIWCFCRFEESGEIIAYENKHCQIYVSIIPTCLRLKSIPRSKWFCP